MRWPVLLAALLLAGCPDEKKQPPRAGRAGLRVPLPDGWAAVPVGDRLEAGPLGHPAVLLESREAALPSVEALVDAVARDGVRMTSQESNGLFVAVSYLLSVDAGAGLAAFVAVKRSGAKVVWCSSAPAGRPEDLAAALALCRDVSWEDLKP